MSEEGFLSRWSRRKRAPEAEAPQPEQEAEAPPPAPRPEQDCSAPLEPELDLTALPRIEDLDLSSDLTAFLRPGIPTALRSAALRRMWSLDPSIRDFIGPADYAWDYNTVAGMPPGFSFDLGGNLKELLAQAIGEREEKAPPAEAEAPDPDIVPEPAAPQLVAEATPEAAPEPLPRAEPEPESGAPRRRHGGALPS